MVFSVLDVTGLGGDRGVSGLPHRYGEQTADRLPLCGSRPDLFAQRARGQSAQLYTDVPTIITQIDIQLDDVISRLTARRVPRPGDHLLTARRDDAQQVQRKRQSRLVGFGPAVDQSDRRLQPAVHQTRMEDIVSRRVRYDTRQS